MMTFDLDAELKAMGLDPRHLNVLFFVPAAAVAWADGRIDMEELEAIARRHRCDCQEAECFCLSEEARQYLFFHFAYQKPRHELLLRALNCLRVYLALQPPQRADNLRRVMYDIAVDVALSTGGGVLGLRPRLDERERLVIANIAGALGYHDMERLKEMLDSGSKASNLGGKAANP